MADGIGAAQDDRESGPEAALRAQLRQKSPERAMTGQPPSCLKGNRGKQNGVAVATRFELLENTFPDGIGPAGFSNAQ
jgi:hypothetical protein